MFRRKKKVIIQPLDLVWLDIDPNDKGDGIIVPRVPETWNEVNRIVESIKSEKCILCGYIPARKLLSITKWVDGKRRR